VHGGKTLFSRLDMRRQRQLHEDAVDVGVRVERANAIEQRLLIHVCAKLVNFGMQSDFVARTNLVAHVNLRSRVIASDDYGEPRCDAIGFERTDAHLPLGPYGSRDPIAVDDFRGHTRSPQVRKPAMMKSSMLMPMATYPARLSCRARDALIFWRASSIDATVEAIAPIIARPTTTERDTRKSMGEG
jgi:hypothetical protein